MDTRGDLTLLRGRELQAEAAAGRLVREARGLSRLPGRPGPLHTAVGTALVRAGLRLGGKPSLSGSCAPVQRPYR